MKNHTEAPGRLKAALAGLLTLAAVSCGDGSQNTTDAVSDNSCVAACHQIDSFETPGPCGGECHAAQLDTGSNTEFHHEQHDTVHACEICHDDMMSVLED